MKKKINSEWDTHADITIDLDKALSEAICQIQKQMRTLEVKLNQTDSQVRDDSN